MEDAPRFNAAAFTDDELDAMGQALTEWAVGGEGPLASTAIELAAEIEREFQRRYTPTSPERT